MAEPATNDSPLIMISYHDSDEYWAERLVARMALTSEGRFGLCKERVESNGGTRIDGIPTFTLQLVKVVVILISPKYLEATRVRNEEALKWVPGMRQDVLWLMVHDTPKEQLRQLPSRYLSMNSTPLAEATTETANVILGKVANVAGAFAEHEPESRGTQPPDNKQFRSIAADSRYAWSDEAENGLRRARRLATGSAARAVTTAALLFGLAEGGRLEVDYFRTPQFLWDELTAGGNFLYTKMLTEEFAALGTSGEEALRSLDSISEEADLVTTNVVKVFELAEEVARRTVRLKPEDVLRQEDAVTLHPLRVQIGARHLLAALLVLNPDDGPTGAGPRLAAIVGDVTALRKRFYNFIVKSLPDDDHDAWRRILINLELPDIQPPPAKQPKPQQRQRLPQPSVAGFMADDWQGRDLLGITRDVNALASLVAAYKVEPPLSIGLFGDWGSGKSHFMRQMRQRVELLSKGARHSGKPQNELGYYKNIVQIEFNAWHYIEGNLWASLVDHIFANLKLSEKEPRSFAEGRRDDLLQKLGLKEELKKKIDFQVEECEAELRKVEDRKQQAEVELSNASTQLANFRRKAEASLETLTVAVTLSTEEKELLTRLGVDAGGVIKGAELRKKYDELKGPWNRIKAQWQLFRSSKGVVSRYLLSAVLVTIAFGGPLLLKLEIFPRIPTVILTVLGFIATFLTAIKPVRDQFNKTLKALEKHDQEIERERLKRITELESKVNALGSEVVAAKLKSETVGREIDQLKTDIASTSSTRLLAEFIEDRAAASDYRRHLGLLALIRRDFEKLRDLFDQQRKEESQGNEVSDDKKINRIVLYIDDLDRCPPDRVVQVLQAIHLLLAFPLFVVVVGVDSRWITRSLQQSYDWLREMDDDASNGETKNGTEEQDGHRSVKAAATPHDYLEKIFQIPFWLRSMNEDACVELLDGLTRELTDNGASQVNLDAKQQVGTTAPIEPIREATAPAETPASTFVSSVEKAVDSTVEDPIQGAVAFVPVKEENEFDEIDLAPQSLMFTTFEIEYMKELVPLIGRSPRAVKRFLNCYRLIKVGLTPAELPDFVEEGKSQSYRAAMILLGVITGAPSVASYVMDKLKTQQPELPERTVEAFFSTIAMQKELQQQPDAQRFFRFFKGRDFGKYSELLLEDMAAFAPRVSRFSFRVNPTDLLRR